MTKPEGLIKIQFKTKILASICCLVLVLGLVPSVVLADEYDDKINALNEKINQNQTAVNQKQAEANTLHNKLAVLQGQINSAQAELNVTKLQIAQTNEQLKKANEDLEKQKKILKENMVVMYKQGNISTLELLASSDNLSDYVSKQEYLSAIRQKVNENLVKIDQLKRELDEKKHKLDILAFQQKAQVDNIDRQRDEQQSILSKTQGEEAAYQQLVSSDKADVAKLKAQQAAAIAARSSNNVYGGTGGYPWAHLVQDSGADPWGFYYRECTSYAAWRRANIGRPIPAWGRMGPADAKTWPNWARNFGYRVDSSPEVGAIAVYGGGRYGHVMIVESIKNNGATVHVSEYNADMTGHYSESDWPTSAVTFIH